MDKLDKLDKFIYQHKEYFKRNEEYLISNDWHLNKTYSGPITEKKTKTAQLSQIRSKSTNLESDKKLVTNIVNRLSAFIKRAEADRHQKKVKDFIEYTADIVKLFIQKCNIYIDTNDISKIEDEELKNEEISLQDQVFNEMIKIQDSLDNMNIYSEVENIEVKFYGSKIASLILKEPLELKIVDVKRKVEDIQIDWNVLSSNEMYINMNKKDIPQWNEKKHFWDQDKVTLQFWTEEYNKILKGITIGGYFVHPWLYFHLNFYKTPIPTEKNKEPIINPYFRDNEWFFVENLKKAEDAGDKGLLVYGSRRISKSVILSSYIHWKAITKFNAVATVTSGSESDLATLTSKIKTSLDYIEPAFRLEVQKQAWDGGNNILGIKTDSSNTIAYSTISIKNLAQGTKRASQKPAGDAPSAFVNDEIGKYAFLDSYLAALPSFKAPWGFKCVPILVGTGGEADLSKDAMSVLKNPEVYNLLSMDWDLLESKIDPEYITWKRRNFGTFYPGQMAYEVGLIKNEEKFSDFLGIKNEELDKITIQKTDWKNAPSVLNNILESKKKEKGVNARKLEQQHKVQYPLDPEDCFLTIKQNPFLPLEVRQHKKRIQETGDIGKKVILYEKDEKVYYELAEDKQVPEFPFPGGFCDAPVVIFIEPPEYPQEYEFIAGLDDYKQEESKGDSVGSFTIYRRNCFDDKGNMEIAAVYDSRPDPHAELHRQGLMLLKLYNAKCFPENEDMDFKLYTDNKGETWKWLVKGINLAQDLDLNSAGGRREFGWNPTPKNIAFMHGLVKRYVREELKIKNEEGEVVEVRLGLTRIKSVGLLEELENFKEDENFDRIRSFGSALMYDHYLTSQFIIPTPYVSDEERRKKRLKAEINKLKRQSRSSMFGKSSGKLFGN